MANQNRDVKMTLSVETLGTEGVKKLQSDILNLAQGAGDAAPEFERLAEEIGRIGEQADALAKLQELNKTTDDLAAKQAEAAASTDTLKQRLIELENTTAKAADEQRAAAAAYDAARDKLRQTNGELTILRNSYDANGERVANYKTELERLVRVKVQEQEAIAQTKRELTLANDALRQAEDAQNKQQAAYDKSNKSLTEFNAALRDQQAAVSNQRASLEQMGVTTDSVAQAQEGLRRAMDTTLVSAERLRANIEFSNETLNGSVAATQRYEAALVEEAQARERAAAAAAQEAAEARRVADLKQQIRDRIVQYARERAQAEVEASARVATQGYAREAAEAERVANLKQQINARLIQYEREKAAAIEAANLQAVEAARRAAQAMGDAFDTIGVRSLQSVQQEIEEVRQAMQRVAAQSGLTGGALAAAMTAGNSRINELQREVRELTGTLTLADKAADLLKNSMGQIAAGNLIADGIGYVVNKVKEMGQAFIDAQIQSQTLNRALTVIYGSAQTAGQQIDFLRGVAVRSGVALGGLSDSFVRFNAATATANIPLAQSNALFESLTRAGSTLGVSSERVTLALDAIGQMASKGVVSMEELRQQLGDSIPGALSMTAKGLGITDAELVKLVESGRLATRDFIPAFTKGLSGLQGETEGLRQTWDRFKTTLTITAQGAGDAGWTVVLGGALKILAGIVGTLALGLSVLTEGFFLLGKGAAALVATLTGSSEALRFFGEDVDAATKRLSQQTDAFNAMLDPSSQAARNIQATADANTRAAASAGLSAAEIERTAVSYSTAAAESLKLKGAQEASAVASQVLADETRGLGSQFVQLGVQMTEIAARQEAEIVVRGKATAAAKDQAEALTRVAGLRKDDVAAAEAAVQAATLVIEAQAQEVASRQALAGTLAVELQAKTDLAIQQDGSIAGRKAELDLIAEKLKQAGAEADQAAAELKNLTAAKVALEEKRKAMADTGAEAEQLRQEMQRANAELESVRSLARFGAASLQDLTTAEEAAARAAGRYKDALSDQNQSLQVNIQLSRAKADLRIAELRGQLEEAQNAERIARLKGDEAAAERAVIEQKRLGIEIARLSASAKNEEITATIALLEKQREEITGNDDTARALRAQIDLRILNEKAKLAEAKAGDSVVKALEAERNAIVSRNRAASSGGGGSSLPGSSSGGSGGGSSSSNRPTETGVGDLSGSVTERNASMERDQFGRTAAQRAAMSQQGGATDASYVFQLRDRLQRGETFTADEIPAIQNALRVAQSNQMLMNTPGAGSLSGMADADAWVATLTNILERASGSSNTGGGVGIARNVNVNLRLGNNRTTLSGLSQQNADNLTSFLSQLESASGTAT